MVMLDIPPQYGYVILSGVTSFVGLFILGGQVGSARKRLGVPLPYMYADMASAKDDKKKELFNCYQRGHQNALETYSGFLMMLFVGGLKHPLICATSGIVWTLGRIVYALGYQSGNPDKRYYGEFFFLGQIGVLGCSISVALSLLGWL